MPEKRGVAARRSSLAVRGLHLRAIKVNSRLWRFGAPRDCRLKAREFPTAADFRPNPIDNHGAERLVRDGGFDDIGGAHAALARDARSLALRRLTARPPSGRRQGAEVEEFEVDSGRARTAYAATDFGRPQRAKSSGVESLDVQSRGAGSLATRE
jgi:hypothetical protein